MGSLNVVHLIGHLGKDAELRYASSGAAMTTLSLATSKAWKDKHGAKREKTEWHCVRVFGKMAEALVAHFRKGAQVFVAGELQTREWLDNTNKKHSRVEIVAEKIVLLGPGQRRDREGADYHLADEDVGSAIDPAFQGVDE